VLIGALKKRRLESSSRRFIQPTKINDTHH
jgi:hypothetical protein